MNSKKDNKRQIGTRYEQYAADYLEKHGYQIIEKNYRNRYGEIDLIAYKEPDKMSPNGTVVYVEVKYRSSEACGSPLEAVDVRKQKKISKTAQWHYADFGYQKEMACRFDVIAVFEQNGIQINHIENAFSFQGNAGAF